MSDRVDQRPTRVERGDPIPSARRLRDEVRGMAGVVGADVRLREAGHVFSGEI